MTVEEAIVKAERILPGVPAPDGKKDPRWQAIIRVGEHVEDHPQQVWSFIQKWGKHQSEDISMAIATVLLEHLLEYHFADFFPLVRKTSLKSKFFADTFQRCGQFGQAIEPRNSKLFKALEKELSREYYF